MKLILQAIKALFRKIEISLAQSLSHFKADMMGRIDSIQSTANTKMDAINPVGTGSFSMGREPGSVIGDCSHAEGSSTTASGYGSHAEGNSTTASGDNSHAEGCSTIASGSYSSHAEGFYTTASGMHSHAEGFYTTASSSWQHVQGQYNVEDSSNKYAHIVGNGTSYVRSNAHTLDWNGVPWFKDRPQFGGTSQDQGSQTVMANGDKEIILKSSTANSTKKFKITVDDSGTISATEVT